MSFIIVVSVVLGIGTTSHNRAKQADAAEKIPFSHATHIEKYNINDCGTCHKYDGQGTFRGLPSIGDCTACHNRNNALTSTDHMAPRKKTVFDYYADKDRPWVSKSEDKQLVYYSHKVALGTDTADGKKQLRCEPCHGGKVSSNSTARGEKLMKQCIECHTTFKMNNQCDVCHR
jgi:hypothetical protein